LREPRDEAEAASPKVRLTRLCVGRVAQRVVPAGPHSAMSSVCLVWGEEVELPRFHSRTTPAFRAIAITRLRKQSPYPRGHLPFVRREHVIGAAVGSCSRRRSRPPGIRADEGSPRGGRHLFVSDDERVAGVNA
jgi:hypothetical protein